MVLAFDNTDIRQVCEDEETAKMEHGSVVADILHDRLADMLAADCIADVFIFTGGPAEISEGTCIVYGIPLTEGHGLVFSCNHATIPMKGGMINWNKVRNIKLLKIVEWP